ncbi:MAG: ABC transporter ATP-binding protein [candidate division WOR-3 bacterium]|uniref:ABC transporter ATP-binding protein n=2 Tax=candidate division WOR-3 bacterium TaxID=2052148 RepID=A0A7C1T0K4_UNCW3|nr:ABC transporter ATP-binding protein [candidate division WOR-3 bacterium]
MLTVSNISVAYGAISALREITFNVEKGEIVTLIGANGAGKTTTLKCISGLIKPRQGEILFEGKKIDRLPAHQITKMGIVQVPEGRKPFVDLTVWENLLLGAFNRPKNEIATALERVFNSFPRLRERLHQRAGTLSGGELQMMAMARGLIANPKLLMLDEPSMGLSPLLVREIFSIIREINRAGTSILLVEQNAFMALKVAHRAYVLETGRIVLSGTASDLIEHPKVKAAYLGE